MSKEEDTKTTIQLYKSDKILLEKKKKELGLSSVAEVQKKLIKYLDRIK